MVRGFPRPPLLPAPIGLAPVHLRHAFLPHREQFRFLVASAEEIRDLADYFGGGSILPVLVQLLPRDDGCDPEGVVSLSSAFFLGI